MAFWPFNRKPKEQPKSERAYSGAMYNRLVHDWVSANTSIDAEIRGSLRALRNRSRALERDNDYVRSFLREVENNVIGQGIPFQAQVRKQRGGKPDDVINQSIENSWNIWSRADSCHTGGKLSFQDIERLLMRSVARDGDMIVRLVRKKFGRSRVPLALEIIEADRLDENYNDRSANGNEIRMGVELDEWQRPVAYYFFKYHPGDYPFVGMKTETGDRRIRIPASEIIHPFVCERPGQTRGVPWTAAAIMRLRHLQGYEEAEVIAARAGASLMGFIQSPEGELRGDDVEAGERVTDFQPGVFKYLAPGETVNVPNTQRPNSQFDPFLRAMVRGTAAGLGISYETISKDYSQTNYSSSRQALINERDAWRSLQRWVIENFHQRVYEAWLDMAVLSGELSFPDYETNPDRYRNVRWMPRGWQWVDPAKEVAAYKEAIKGGLTSLSSVIAQQGDDYEELVQQIAREREQAESLGLVFDTDAANDTKQMPPNSPPDTENNQ